MVRMHGSIAIQGPRPWLDVRAYGAKGDGATDDAAAIQSAVDAAYDAAANIVFIPSGTYITGSPINLYSGIRLIGSGASEGYGGTRIRGAHTGNVFQFDTTKATAWFHHGGIEDIFIRSDDNVNKAAAGIYIYQAGENCILRNLVLNNLVDGIVFGDGTNTTAQVSPRLENISGHFNSGALLRSRKNGSGMINVTALSGDDNGNILLVEDSGAGFSMSIDGLKSETTNAAYHDPAIKFASSYLQFTLTNGWVTCGAATGTQDAIQIVTAGAPKIALIGVGYLHYVNAINDVVNSVLIPITDGSVMRTPIFYNTSFYRPRADNVTDLGSSTARFKTGYFGTSVVAPAIIGGVSTGVGSSQIYGAQDGANAELVASVAGTGTPAFIGTRSGGTHASRTNVGNGQGIAAFMGRAYSAQLFDADWIKIIADGAPTNNQRPPTRVSIRTNTDGGAETEHFDVNRNGRVKIHTSGLVVGAPTGDDKGLGSINVAGDIYKNNTAYTNPDYVFEPGYKLQSLPELEAYILANKHLPGVSREASGMFERADILLEKVEELTLHIIELQKQIEKLREE